jgi:uncharacterized radical SAM protein YgiQ
LSESPNHRDSSLDPGRWLPVSREELAARGWDEVDVILVSGDAYVDHPAFGTAVIGRILEREGLRVAINPQPNWRDDLRDFRKLGAPRLFFGVTAGCMDSMINRYTAARRPRTDDAYTPGGEGGFRPDYAVTVYSRILKQLFPDVPVVIGGIEASLRRVTHYDYWSDSIRPTVLAESGADLLVYGMGEQPLIEILRLLGRGVPFASLKTVAQTAVLLPPGTPAPKTRAWEDVVLHSHEACLADRTLYAANARSIEIESNRARARRLVQPCGDRLLVVNPPCPTMTTAEIDASFDLPYTRLPHPRYRKRGAIPAYEMIRHSINTHRGCFGGCAFCTIAAHQGRFVASRSLGSILREVEAVKAMPDFAGTLSDLGGPSANMYRLRGKAQDLCDACTRPSCLWPRVCPNLATGHGPLLEVYEAVRRTPGVKHAFVTSGVRYDLLLAEGVPPDEQRSHDRYIDALVAHHVSGRLKVAPEHTSDDVLKIMRKPSFALFEAFKQRFDEAKKRAGRRELKIVPYFISSHPGSRLQDMADLAVRTKALGFELEQVQDFTPTPMTVATEIYATGVHPHDGRPVYCARTLDEKLEQRSFFFWYKPEARAALRGSLRRLGLEAVADRLLGPGGASAPPTGPRHGRPGRSRGNR